MSNRLNVLFLCVANSARSQLAEGLAKSILPDNAHIESAGSEPSGIVQPWAITVLKESGIDISKNWSKSIADLPQDFLENLDYVITLCAEEVCPVFLSKAKRLHWPILDPAKAPNESKELAFRKASEDIKSHLEDWLKTL